MKFKTKVAIFLAAVFLTLVGFNLIASPAAIDLLKVGKEVASDQMPPFLSHADAHYTITVEG
jgi:hypothetical protein